MKIDGSIIRELIDYNPVTGVFTWRKREYKWFNTNRAYNTWNSKWAGKVAGRVANGYIGISVLGKTYYAHRLAWLYMKGEWPDEIDHKDRDGTNNSWNNLEASNRFKNNQNKGVASNNTSGFTGVTRSLRRWQAKITRNGVERYLGTFDTPEEASKAYQDAEENL